ncbi:MAG: class I SAM-dependent methyltransferase [Gemmataceae bacterium]|nr:class I SAM-dependent methyltransferase [Gemmataceae bacterium]
MSASLFDERTPSVRWGDPSLLDHLQRVRRPWNRLTRRIVCGILATVAPEDTGSAIVEIGAGDGQLREWLPSACLPNLTHSEPSEPFLQRLRQRFPEAHAIHAKATSLPFETASVAAVLGLCVFDSLPDLPTVRDELRCVLRQNGVVVHFLDLATNPDCLFPELIAHGEIPLTNFARDPALLAVLSDGQKALLPVTKDFDEILAIDGRAFAKYVTMLESAGHPLVQQLGAYRGLDPYRLAQEYMTVSADPAKLLATNKALLSLTLSARSLGRDWPIRSISTRDHLRAQLTSTFTKVHGFQIVYAGPVSAWETDATIPEGCPMLLRHAGQTRALKEILPLPGQPIEQWAGVPTVLPSTGPIRACTVEVFVAQSSPLAPREGGEGRPTGRH